MSAVRSIEPSDSGEALATVSIIDIASSTALIVELGEGSWPHLLQAFYGVSADAISRHQGLEIGHTGDGTKAIFGLPAHAIEYAFTMRRGLQVLNLEIRVGLNVGQVRWAQGSFDGLAIHIAARIVEKAQVGEILVSNSVRDISLGTHYKFQDRGLHQLKGIPGWHQLWSVAS
jgi:class 3 adenylate cyclase